MSPLNSKCSLILFKSLITCRKELHGEQTGVSLRLESDISSTQLDLIKWHKQYNQGTEKRARDVVHGCQKGKQSVNAQDPLEVKMYQNDLWALFGCRVEETDHPLNVAKWIA